VSPAGPGVARLSALLASRQTSSRELAEDFLRREARERSRLHAFVVVDADDVLAQADAADAERQRGSTRGPLHGILVGIKDIVDVRGYPTRNGSPLYGHTPADADAEVVVRLRRSGAIIAGKTTTHELACGVVSAPARNPHDPTRVPGGSSGGSAVAVATGLVPIAIGSDTGGSIRIPAALCGTAGLKPTFGIVPTTGALALSPSLDHLGPLGATVADCAVALDVLAGTATRDHVGGSVDGLRVGILTHAPIGPVEPAVAEAFACGVELLRGLGIVCVNVTVPELTHVIAAEFGIIPHEAAAVHARALRERPADIDAPIRTLAAAGLLLPARVHRRALAARDAIGAAIHRAMDHAGVATLATPTLPATAATLEHPYHTIDGTTEHIGLAYVRTTAAFNLSGQPALTVPCGSDPHGLPIGFQIVARRGDDGVALRIGAALEAGLGGSDGLGGTLGAHRDHDERTGAA
jgi:aspartyl-tRNA(Asn)/glutamyl-tRNA(Gln) amidotransferase subunit A